MDHFKNMSGSDYLETHPSLEELNANSASFDSSLPYSYGVLALYTKSFARIKPAYYSYEYDQKREFDPSETVIFYPKDLPADAPGVESEEKINTPKNVYLVRYLDGGVTTNEKTGETQPTIDSSVPVTVLLKCVKKQCLCLMVEDGVVTVKTASQVKPEQTDKTVPVACKELDEAAISALASAVHAQIDQLGFVYAAKFPDILQKVCGTNDVRQYAPGVRDFVEKYLADSFRYEQNYSYEGKKIPGVILPRSTTVGVVRKQKKAALTEEKKEIIFSAIKAEMLKNKGAIKPTEVPKVLDSLWEQGIDRTIYRGEPLQSWLNTNFPQLYVSSSVNGGGHEYIYLQKVTPEEIRQVGLTESAVEKIRIALVGYLMENSSVAVADISRKVFMPNGIDPRFYPLGKSVREWLMEQEQFTFSEDESSISLSPKFYAQLQIPDSVPAPVPAPPASDPFTDADREELDGKFDREQYVEFLSSGCFRRLNPSEIPIEYMEKALTAARCLVFGPSEEAVHLNTFQRNLLEAATNDDFSDWSNGIRYNETIFEQCLDTMLFSGTKAIAAQKLNELVHSSSRADQYLDSKSSKTRGVVSRFQTARNEQTLPLYIVAAFAQDNQSSLKIILMNYCRFVQEIITNNRGAERTLYLSSVLRTILLAPCAQEYHLENATQTLILSVFVDTYSIDTLDDDLVHALFPDEDRYHRSLIALIKQHETWDEAAFVDFIAKGPNLQLLERCIALIWGQLLEKANFEDIEQYKLPESFLRLLSWIVTYYDRATLDAVIDFPTMANGQKVSRKTKCFMLFRGLPTIQKLAEEENSFYNLGSYLSNYLFAEFEETTSTDLAAQGISQSVTEWLAFSKRRFERRKQALLSAETGRKEFYADLFREYWLDKERELLLQQMYAEEVLAEEPSSPSEQEQILLGCLSMRAYRAYCLLYQRAQTDGTLNPDGKYRDKYVNALIQIEDFRTLINYLLDAGLDEEAKNRYLAKAICGIFNDFHYSQKAFECFSERFTVDDARLLLQKQMTTTSFPVITALIAIYIHQNELFKARYLYEIFHARAEIGNTRIYAQFRKLFDGKTNHVLQVGKEDNHYNVLQTAFYVLPPQRLLQFLSWASEIKIPDMANYNPQHAHIRAMQNFLKEPGNIQYWQQFIGGLSKRLTQYPVNAWLVCVCDGVLSSVWNLEHSFDVRRAYELVLTQIQDPNIRARYFPVGLMAYITAYIIRKDDEQLCRSLRAVVGDEQLWNRLFVHNAWAEDSKSSLSAFSAYCVRKVKETRDELYADLLKVTAPSVSVDNLLAIASVSGNTDYLIRQLCNSYLEGRQASESQAVASQIDRTSLSFRDIEALELLQTIYSDETDLLERYPELFVNEEAAYAFKQDCASILQYYPNMGGLRAFEENCTDTRYKRFVYSYVFGIFYNKKLYDKYSFDYDAFQNRVDQVIIAQFLRKVFYAQLVYNASYDFFYKRWRYLKLYLTMVIEAGGPADASEIISVMKAHRHDDNVLEDFFLPFQQAVDAYLELPSIHAEEKKRFLYCVMMGHVSEYLSDYSETLLTRTEEETLPMKQIISMLDYRDVSYAIYEHYDSELRAGVFQRAKGAAAALVPAAFDALRELEAFPKRFEAYSVFKCVQQETPAQCVKGMLQLNDSQYQDYHRLIDPLVCSRQFPFQMYKRFHQLVLSPQERASLERYASLCDYLGEKIDRNAPTVFLYLEAMREGIEGNREGVRTRLDKIGNDDYRLPSSWKEEADSLRQFAVGKRDEFHATTQLLDTSTGGARAKKSYHFCITLIERLAAEKVTEKLTRDALLAAWRCYRDKSGSVSESERIIAGAQVLRKPELFSKVIKGLDMSETPDKFALDLGMEVLQTKSRLPIGADDRMEIIAELADHGLNGEVVFPQFDKLLRSDQCSIDCWCKYRNAIRRFVSETGYFSDDTFMNLYTEVLEPCAEQLDRLNALQYSVEEWYTDLEGYMATLSAMKDSVFRRFLYSAMERRLNGIRNGVRLSIKAENLDSNITDGYVYFSIENNGNQSVVPTDFEIQVQGLRCKLEKNFEMLHPQYIIGGRAKLTAAPETDLILQVIYAGVVLSRAILRRDTIRFHGIPGVETKGNDLYNVKRAVQVFGREQQLTQLRELITAESKALIYGPSRIGKTSILDLVRKELAAEKGNVIAVTFAGEGSAKLSDYQEIPENASSEEIEEHLLAESILKAFDERGKRLQRPSALPADAEAEICDILRQNKKIVVRYRILNEYLEAQGLELWLILDEFQQAVMRWTPKETGAFASICADLDETWRIKLIICGSDELLKHMVLNRSSIWRRLLPPDPYGVQVKALEDRPFQDMLRTEPLRSHRSVSDAGISYSPEALTALYRYTGGVPLYGKHIGNQVLKTLRESGDLQKRNVIYTADITPATQILIDEQKNKGDISTIYDDVKKGLDTESDELFLAYIAKYMTDNRVIGCPYSAFTQNPKGAFKFKNEGEEPYKEFDDSLSIAEARGIIKKTDPNAGDPCYTFCTVFYYYAFLGTAKAEFHLEDKLFSRDDESVGEDFGASQVISDYRALPPEERDTALTLIWRGEKDDTIKKSFRDDFFPPQTRIEMNGGDVVTGNKNIAVVQNITNTLNGIFAATGDPGKMLEGLQSLPRLSSYLPALASGAEKQEISESQLARGINNYAADLEEGVEAAIEQTGTELTPLWDILKLPNDEYKEFMRKYRIPQCFLDSLQFAYQLGTLFKEGSLGTSAAEIDYSPATIMYCKLVESMLKEYHTIPYSRAISSVRTNLVNNRRRPEKYRWGDIHKLPQYQQQSLTIGSFVFPIVESNRVSAEMVADNIADLADDTEGTVREWEQHALFIKAVRDIRNPSAHGNRNQRITEAQLDNIMNLLIDEGGFLRLVRLVKEPI